MNLATNNRRSFLRGMGACLALPAFEAFLPGRAFAAGTTSAGIATTASGAPLRMAFVYFPNGAIQKDWTPTGSGKDFAFGNTLAPLEPLRHRVQVVSGLEHLNANAGNDGARRPQIHLALPCVVARINKRHRPLNNLKNRQISRRADL